MVISVVGWYIFIRPGQSNQPLVSLPTNADKPVVSTVEPKVNPIAHQIAQSKGFHHELLNEDFVPAQPVHYFCDLGRTHLKHKNYSEAIKAFNQVLETEKEPHHRADILYDLGRTYLGISNQSKSQTTLQDALQLYEALPEKTHPTG